ncbi:MAG TPA: polysaccharide deacetylase family protein [Terriglobales bacterium]|nr:polysaccharide deacetylase family protein [Terriglobales bacterium]
MNLRSAAGAVRRNLLLSMHRRTVAFGDHGPIVSFSFDDFPHSAWSSGGAILEDLGVRGTYYAAPGLMHTPNDPAGPFSPDDLHAVAERGHELACHTFSHVSSRSVASETFLADVEKARQAVEDVAGRSSLNFAYPFGAVTLRAKRTVGPGFASSRGIFPGLNGPEIDLNLLLANSLYGGIDQSGRVRSLIAENVKKKAWLIFYTHDVQAHPSPHGCTPALFQAAVAAAVDSGSQVLTVQGALEAIGVQSGDAVGHVRSRAMA